MLKSAIPMILMDTAGGEGGGGSGSTAPPAAAGTPPAEPPATPPATPPAAAPPAATPPAAAPPAKPPAAATPPVDPPPAATPPAKPPKPTEAEILNDPNVQRAIKEAADKAAEEAKQQAIADAEKEAERASMTEAEKANAAAADEKVKREAAEAEVVKIQRKSDFNEALAGRDERMHNKAAQDFVRQQAEAKIDKDGLTMDNAVSEVIKENPWVVKTAAGDGVEGAPPKTPPANTDPVVAGGKKPADPPEPDPKKTVDCMKMSAEELRTYQAETYGIQ